jgi:outer membrane lipoprotein
MYSKAMLIRIRLFMVCLLLNIGVAGGCASSPVVVPETLQKHIDSDLNFPQLQKNPEAYTGKMLVLGGEVLSAKRLDEGTQLEVLQLPLDNSQQPVANRTSSQGRFLAIEKNYLDPAMVPPNSRVTIVGEVTGMITGNLDEMSYQYPTVAVQHLHVWKDQPLVQEGRPGPWYSIFGGGSTGGRVGGGVGIGIGF